MFTECKATVFTVLSGSRHPPGRGWIFPEGPGRLGTDMLAVVCPWREGEGAVAKAGHTSTTEGQT